VRYYNKEALLGKRVAHLTFGFRVTENNGSDV